MVLVRVWRGFLGLAPPQPIWYGSKSGVGIMALPPGPMAHRVASQEVHLTATPAIAITDKWFFELGLINQITAITACARRAKTRWAGWILNTIASTSYRDPLLRWWPTMPEPARPTGIAMVAAVIQTVVALCLPLGCLIERKGAATIPIALCKIP